MSFSKDYLDNTFEYLRQLHKSAKNEVVLASNKNNNQLYVIKYIKNINLPYKEIKEIIHPLLPQIEYVYEDAEQTIVVEEYINGRNLAEYLAEKESLPEQDIIYLALAVCGVFKILHGKNIIHRDIKPANFLITNDGKIKLIDFDAARVVKDHKKQDTKYLGTEGYAPPEQYGFSQTDCRSDIYALGITIKDLSGKNYKGKLSKIIDKCTKVNPEQRFQSAEELEQSLKKIQKPPYIKYVLVFVCLIAVILGSGWYFYMQKFQSNLTETVSSVQPDVKQPDISDIKVVEQSNSTETKEQEKPQPTKKESVPENKSSSKLSNSEHSVQNTSKAVTSQTNPAPIEQQQQAKQKRKISKDEIEVYFQFSGMDKVSFKKYMYDHFRHSGEDFPKTSGKISEDYPRSRYITSHQKLTIEIYNNSDEALENATVTINFDKEYLAISPSNITISKGNFVYDNRLDNYNLFSSVYWCIGRIEPGEYLKFNLPLTEFIILKDKIIYVKMDFKAENSDMLFMLYTSKVR